jgi:putative DNA primase/helicase
LDRRAASAELVERLLTVIASDLVDVERKYQNSWRGRLSTLLVIACNELPRFPDSSKALAGRMFPLVLRNSFYGVEDTDLLDQLRLELPGILKWVVQAGRRLRERGFLVSPDSSAETLEALGQLGSPAAEFLDDVCEIGSERSIDCKELFRLWVSWCDENGRQPGTAQSLSRDLRASVPSLVVKQERDGKNRFRKYIGIGLP